jgi:hypothetical protein
MHLYNLAVASTEFLTTEHYTPVYFPLKEDSSVDVLDFYAGQRVVDDE